jgi:hypothetical protein
LAFVKNISPLTENFPGKTELGGDFHYQARRGIAFPLNTDYFGPRFNITAAEDRMIHNELASLLVHRGTRSP